MAWAWNAPGSLFTGMTHSTFLLGRLITRFIDSGLLPHFGLPRTRPARAR